MARLTTGAIAQYEYPVGLTGDSQEANKLISHRYLTTNYSSAGAHRRALPFQGVLVRHLARTGLGAEHEQIYAAIGHHLQALHHNPQHPWPRIVLHTVEEPHLSRATGVLEINDPVTGQALYNTWADDEMRWSNAAHDHGWLVRGWIDRRQDIKNRADAIADKTSAEWLAVIEEWNELYEDLVEIWKICDGTETPLVTLSLRAVTKYEARVAGADVRYSVRPPVSTGQLFLVTARITLPAAAGHGTFEATFDAIPTGRGYSAAELTLELVEPEPLPSE